MCVCPIRSSHSLKPRLSGGVDAESRFSHYCSGGDTVDPPREIHHGLNAEFCTFYYVLYLCFYVSFLQCILRRGCRGRWACQAHVHGGHVQRGSAHRTPLCHVLRPVVSERTVTKFFFSKRRWINGLARTFLGYPRYVHIHRKRKACLLQLELSGALASDLVSTQANLLHSPTLLVNCGWLSS